MFTSSSVITPRAMFSSKTQIKRPEFFPSHFRFGHYSFRFKLTLK
jgi:hypothetical protein